MTQQSGDLARALRAAYEQGFDDAVDLVRVGAKYLGSGIAEKVADDAARVRDDQVTLWEARTLGGATAKSRFLPPQEDK